MNETRHFEEFCARAQRGSGLGSTPILYTTGMTTLSIAPMTGPAAPFVAAAAGLQLLFGKLFGPDPKNVPAAQIEQTFEAAANNAYALAAAGMITVAQALAAEQQFLSMGNEAFSAAKLGDAGSRGLANMTKVIQAEMAVTQKLPSKVTQVLDINKAHGYYMRGGGWYPGSTEGAAQLMDQFLQSLGQQGAIAEPSAAATSPAETATAAVTAPVAGIPVYFWLIAGGIALFALRGSKAA